MEQLRSHEGCNNSSNTGSSALANGSDDDGEGTSRDMAHHDVTGTPSTACNPVGCTEPPTWRDFGLDSDIDDDISQHSENQANDEPAEASIEEFSLGPMNIACTHCGAKHFKAEVKRGRSTEGSRSEFNDCCNFGNVVLPELRGHPLLQRLMERKHGMSDNFIKNIRKYNSALSFSSMVAGSPLSATFQSAYTVHGQIYHYSGDLIPPVGSDPQFAQLYIIDADEATELRMKSQLRDNCDPGLMRQLADIVVAINPLAQSYKMMKRVLDEQSHAGQNAPQVAMVIDNAKQFNRSRYNIPAENEIAAVFVADAGELPHNRAIVVYPKTGRLRRIPIISNMVDPMTYPLLFPYGDIGWSPGLKLRNGRNLSMCQYYGYRMATRECERTSQRGGKLWQQFIVDAYCKVEENNLNYLRYNQQKLRSESYDVLCQHLSSGEQGRVGRRIILPSSFTGGPRSQQQHFQDSMAIVSNFGKPDLFITFTCNPRWHEIQDNLFEGQRHQDRPEIVARVFKAKLDELCKDVINDGLFGKCVAHVGVVEFQKRGLPHAHMLVTLSNDCKLTTKYSIDNVVSATIPDPEKEPRLHDLVRRHMIHGPCGDLNPKCPCMREGECSKKFPKAFSHETVKDLNGYPMYCRPNDGQTILIGQHTMDNRWVVPYNKHLLLKYNCHINVEVCSSLKSIKYLHKYVYKGPDSASLRMFTLNGETESQIDEIADYIDTRYVGSPEAAWRILKFPLHFKSHAIQRLSVHIEDEKSVIYEEGNEEEAVAAAEGSVTTLEAFFIVNQASRDERNGAVPDVRDELDSRNLLYSEMPLKFVFSVKNGWKPRQKRFARTLGRMFFVSPKDSERYYLRMLLLHRKGCYSFSDLRCVHGVQHETFKEAANALGLIIDDREHDKTLSEASEKYSPSQLRHLFVNMLIFCSPSYPQALWDNYKEHFAEDISYRTGNLERSIASAYEIINTIIDGRYALLDNIKRPSADPVRINDDEIWMEDLIDHNQRGNTMYEMLNAEQKDAVDRILLATEDQLARARCFFVDGPGGSGKTFLYETLNHLFKSKGLTVRNVAWSGIAAQLLPRGSTVHSTFKLPVPVTRENYMSFMKANCSQAVELKNTDIIVWDEAPMSPRYGLEGVDALLKDLCGNDQPFGGKVVILGGDFRQIPPVVRGSAAATVEANLKRSSLWHKFTILSLSINIRANADPAFAELLMQVGNGEYPHDENAQIKVPDCMISGGNLIEEIYGDTLAEQDYEEIPKRAILCPKNKDCFHTNEQILKILPGDEKVYYSSDSISSEDDGCYKYPLEFLHSLTPSGKQTEKFCIRLTFVLHR